MLLKKFANRFIDKFQRDQTTTLAASLAFYTSLSLAPLLILFVTFSSLLSPDIQNSFLAQVRDWVGEDAALAVEIVMQNAAKRRDLSSVGSLFGFLTLILSASLIFGELRSTLNRIFCVQEREHPDPSYWHLAMVYLRDRVLNAGLALSFVFILIISLVASSVISANVHSREKALMTALDLLISFVFFGGLFSLVYRYLPAEKLLWARAWRGGFLTSLLFVAGKQVIGTYLGNSALGSSYGAAGSVIVLLAWVYYSALITFVGAQLSALLKFGRGRTV